MKSPAIWVSINHLNKLHKYMQLFLFLYSPVWKSAGCVYSWVGFIFCSPPQVTLFHAESEADSSHSFTIDQAVRSVRLHVAGKPTHCVLINPKGTHTHTPMVFNIANDKHAKAILHFQNTCKRPPNSPLPIYDHINSNNNFFFFFKWQHQEVTIQ